ncbi:MAG TPA: S41 family peptidase [Flavobacterium sp.]|jgi:hypothetical protein
MKSILSIILIFIAVAASAQTSRSHYKTDLDFGNGTVFSTFFDVTRADGRFTITSPKDADVRIFGGKAKLGRAMGKSPKKGIIINITGEQKKDSLFGETTIPMFGKLKFKGILSDDKLAGVLLKDNENIGSVSGVASKDDKIDYSDLYPLIFRTIQDNIYSKNALQGKEWNKFQKEIEKLCNVAHDDIELFLGFNILNQSLPFTHLNFFITEEQPDTDEAPGTKKSVVFEEKNPSTAYVQIKNFTTSKDELAVVLPQIVANPNYTNLIIDLRDNGGGGIDAAFEFAKHITDSDMEVGYFLTNKLSYNGFQPDLFRTLPELQPKSTKDFGAELRTTKGAKLIFNKPANPVFTGKMYVLTNAKTASTCEPLVYVLKNSKKAIIIGENTAGAMLAAFPFVVSGKYTLVLPIGDFYTTDGTHLDKVGVAPDIQVKSEDALTRALEVINGGKI